MRYSFFLAGVRGGKGVEGAASGQPGDVTAQMTSPGARVLSQCTAMTTPGPPQGQLPAGSRHLIRELCCPQPLAVRCAREQPQQQTSSASSRSSSKALRGEGELQHASGCRARPQDAGLAPLCVRGMQHETGRTAVSRRNCCWPFWLGSCKPRGGRLAAGQRRQPSPACPSGLRGAGGRKQSSPVASAGAARH